MNVNKPKFLLVYSALTTGGIETLIVRMANWLVENDYDVKILLRKKSDLDYLLNDKVELKYLGYRYELLFYPLFNKRYVKKNLNNSIDIIYSFDLKTCWLSSLIFKNMLDKPIFATGFYHPNAYSLYNKIDLLFFHKLLTNCIPDESMFFMNKECKRCVENEIEHKFSSENIFPLPIEIPKALNSLSFPLKKIKIVSIGRLVSFKTYNLNVLYTILELKNKGYNVEYFIYGTGKLDVQMTKLIADLGLKKNVFLKGNVSYEKIRSILSDAYIFIGMGTSLIEASVLGVPSIVAIVNDKDNECYGFFHNSEEFTVGEFVPNKVSYKFTAVIEEAIGWSHDTYLKERNKGIEKGREFGMDPIMTNFIGLLKKMESSRINNISNIAYANYFLFNFIKMSFLKLRHFFKSLDFINR